MMPHAISHAHWFAHVNGVNPSPEMRGWLVDTASLTAKLTAQCRRFRVRRLHQRQRLCLADEAAVIGLPQRQKVVEREVLLQCDGQPMVLGHTVVPLSATATQWPQFRSLGERSLGTTLFGDPRVERGSLQFARLQRSHPLVRRAQAALQCDRFHAALFARRCLYRRQGAVLLVTEVFLPAIADIGLLLPGRPE